MPFDFVNGLKDRKWIKLDNKWLKDVKKSLKQAVSNSIKDVMFVHTIMKDDTTGTESNFFNKDNDHIYQVPWTMMVRHFLCQLCANNGYHWRGRMDEGGKVSPWGVTKKSSNWSQLSIGDNIIVSNHGTKWEQYFSSRIS